MSYQVTDVQKALAGADYPMDGPASEGETR